MGYSWRESAEKEGAPPQERAERIPAGIHEVCFLKVVYGKRNEPPWRSDKGHPQIMVILQDHQAREAPLWVTLSKEAVFVLSRLMAICDPPVNLARLEEDGIEPAQLADPEFIEGILDLLGRKFTAEFSYPKGNGGFPEVKPIRTKPTTEAPPMAADDHLPPADDPPPASDEPPPSTGMTKDQAWKSTMANWDAACKAQPAAKDRRNELWQKAIKNVGKDESAFTQQDWATVATALEVPF